MRLRPRPFSLLGISLSKYDITYRYTSLTVQENATKINKKFHDIRNPNLFETGEDDMIITDKRIRELCSQRALISPYHENNLQSESYDVTIGSKLISFNREIFCLDIAKQSEIDKIYNEIDFPEDGYVIAAKEYILLSLGETISLPDNISAHIRPKTNCNRLGLLVTPQHCNSSYHGKLRIGVFNATAYPIRIEHPSDGRPRIDFDGDNLDQRQQNQ